MKIEPPALPEPWPSTESVAVESTWDALERAILDTLHENDKRSRVKWGRFYLTRWHCWRPMRYGRVQERPPHANFGWRNSYRKFFACQRCGFFKDKF